MRSVAFTILLEYRWFCELDSRDGGVVLDALMADWRGAGSPSLAGYVPEWVSASRGGGLVPVDGG